MERKNINPKSNGTGLFIVDGAPVSRSRIEERTKSPDQRIIRCGTCGRSIYIGISCDSCQQHLAVNNNTSNLIETWKTSMEQFHISPNNPKTPSNKNKSKLKLKYKSSTSNFSQTPDTFDNNQNYTLAIKFMDAKHNRTQTNPDVHLYPTNYDRKLDNISKNIPIYDHSSLAFKLQQRSLNQSQTSTLKSMSNRPHSSTANTFDKKFEHPLSSSFSAQSGQYRSTSDVLSSRYISFLKHGPRPNDGCYNRYNLSLSHSFGVERERNSERARGVIAGNELKRRLLFPLQEREEQLQTLQK